MVIIMNNILKYKNYYTKIEFVADSKTLFGKIEGIQDLVTFESDDIKCIEEEFHKAVDEYLEFCEEVGKIPDRTYNGSFNVRIDSSLHREISLYALRNGISLNQAVEQSIRNFLSSERTYIKHVFSFIDIDSLFKKVVEGNRYLWESNKLLDPPILKNKTTISICGVR